MNNYTKFTLGLAAGAALGLFLKSEKFEDLKSSAIESAKKLESDLKSQIDQSNIGSAVSDLNLKDKIKEFAKEVSDKANLIAESPLLESSPK